MRYKLDNLTVRIPQHSIAIYPDGFRGFVVSENKICIQFSPALCKARLEIGNDSGLVKGHPAGRGALPIEPNGTELKGVAVGIHIEEHKIMLDGLLKAYKEHIVRFGPTQMRDFLLNFANRIIEEVS